MATDPSFRIVRVGPRTTLATSEGTVPAVWVWYICAGTCGFWG